MQAVILYSLGNSHPYIVRRAEIAQSGKTIDLGHFRPRVWSFVWGQADETLVAEADSINLALEALDMRRRALNATLKATQPALLAAAAKAPPTPKVVAPPAVPLLLADDIEYDSHPRE